MHLYLDLYLSFLKIKNKQYLFIYENLSADQY